MACKPGLPEQTTDTAIAVSNFLASISLRPLEAFDAPLALQPGEHGEHVMQRLDVWSVLLWLQEASQQDTSRRGYTAQLQFVRLGAKPGQVQRASQWAAHSIYWARLRVQNSTGESWQSAHVARAALGLAGADPERVWLGQWRLTPPHSGAEITIESADLALALNYGDSVEPRPLTLLPGFGDVSPVGYVQAPMTVQGQLRLHEQALAVSGQAWFDHIWGNGMPVASGQLGVVRLRAFWDNAWLDCTQLRRRSGGGTPLGGCTLFDGQTLLSLDRRSVELTPRYALSERMPLEWSLRISQIDLELRIAAQREPNAESLIEMPAVVEGHARGQAVQGKAWLEVAGLGVPDPS